MVTRRRFLQWSAASVVIAGAGSLITTWDDPPHPAHFPPPDGGWQILQPQQQAFWLALAPAVLHPLWPVSMPRQHVERFLHQLDSVLANLAHEQQEALNVLLQALRKRLFRHVIAGVSHPWQDATRQEVDAFLQDWRHSSFTHLRAGYQGLKTVVFAAWYADQQTWPHIGYPGPPHIKK